MNTQSLIERLASMDTGVPLHNIRTGNLDATHIELLKESFKRLAETKIYIDANFSSDLNYIVSTIRKFNRIHGVNLVYVDYAHYLQKELGMLFMS